MNTKLLSHARQLFRGAYTTRSQERHNIRRWVRSIRILGPKWLYAELQPLVRKEPAKWTV